MKLPISPRATTTIMLFVVTIPTANVVAMRWSISSAAPQQPRELSELEKFVQQKNQALQRRIARGVWNGTIQPGQVAQNVAQAEEIKAAQEEIEEKQRQMSTIILNHSFYANSTEEQISGLDQIDKLIDIYTVNVADPNNRTPLMVVLNDFDQNNGKTKTKIIEIAKKLLLTGANTNMQDRHALTALHVAAYANAYQIIPLLIAHSANLDQQTSADGETPLMIAAKQGNLRSTRALLEPIKQETLATEWKDLPLELIPNITKEFLGADPMIEDRDGNTAADLAKTDDIRKIIIERMILQLTAEDANDRKILRPIIRGIYKCKEDSTKNHLLELYKRKLKQDCGKEEPEISNTIEALKAINDEVFNALDFFDKRMSMIHSGKGFDQQVASGQLDPSSTVIMINPDEADQRITDYIQPVIEAIKTLNGMPRQIVLNELIKVIQRHEKEHEYKEQLQRIADPLINQLRQEPSHLQP